MSVSAETVLEKIPELDTMNEETGMKIITQKEMREIRDRLTSVIDSCGFECHPFKIGWYNEQVARCFHLPYHDDTLAFVAISTPGMFEKAFIPFLAKVDCLKINQDPIDQCMIQHLSAIKREFSSTSIEIIHDFELTPNKRPKILVQTAGHIAGAVRFYQRKDVTSVPWDPKKKVFGVCLHPIYGGWFALRGVVIFTRLQCPQLPRQQPREILKTEEEVVELLRRYNDRWHDWSFRDIIPVQEKYSEEQKEYFGTRPEDRKKLIERYQSFKNNI